MARRRGRVKRRHNSCYCYCENVPRRLFVRHGEEVLCPRMSHPLPCLRAWVLGYSGSSHVEVLCESGAHYSGHVEEGSLSLLFRGTRELASTPGSSPSHASLSLPSGGPLPPATSHPGTHSFSIGVEVEVLNTARDSEAFGWWPARVKEIRSNVAVLCSSDSAGELLGLNQVVHKDRTAFAPEFARSQPL